MCELAYWVLCKLKPYEKEIFFIVNILLSGTVATLITSFQENRRRKKQNKYQDAKANLPILLEILEDLNILEQAYVFNGRFSPQLEHREPTLSNVDGDGLKMSFAQRGHQFQMIGYRIIRNCRKMLFLTPKGHLPEVWKICGDIKKFLCSKEAPDSKTYLDRSVIALIGSLSREDIDRSAEIEEFAVGLRQLHDALDSAIERELPLLSE
jgi:hypothetical protein